MSIRERIGRDPGYWLLRAFAVGLPLMLLADMLDWDGLLYFALAWLVAMFVSAYAAFRADQRERERLAQPATVGDIERLAADLRARFEAQSLATTAVAGLAERIEADLRTVTDKLGHLETSIDGEEAWD